MYSGSSLSVFQLGTEEIICYIQFYISKISVFNTSRDLFLINAQKLLFSSNSIVLGDLL